MINFFCIYPPARYGTNSILVKQINFRPWQNNCKYNIFTAILTVSGYNSVLEDVSITLIGKTDVFNPTKRETFWMHLPKAVVCCSGVTLVGAVGLYQTMWIGYQTRFLDKVIQDSAAPEIELLVILIKDFWLLTGITESSIFGVVGSLDTFLLVFRFMIYLIKNKLTLFVL